MITGVTNRLDAVLPCTLHLTAIVFGLWVVLQLAQLEYQSRTAAAAAAAVGCVCSSSPWWFPSLAIQFCAIVLAFVFGIVVYGSAKLQGITQRRRRVRA